MFMKQTSMGFSIKHAHEADVAKAYNGHSTINYCFLFCAHSLLLFLNLDSVKRQLELHFTQWYNLWNIRLQQVTYREFKERLATCHYFDIYKHSPYKGLNCINYMLNTCTYYRLRIYWNMKVVTTIFCLTLDK